MKIKLALLALLFCAASGRAGHSDYSIRETRALTHDFAKCVVDHHPRSAKEAILESISNDTIVRHHQELMDEDCLTRLVHVTTSVKFGGDQFRYALADVLVNRELSAVPPPDVSELPPLEWRLPPGAPEIGPRGEEPGTKGYEAAVEHYGEAVAYAFLARYGECVVRADTPGAKEILLTKADTAEESARFGQLQAALARCLPENKKLTFGKASLRGAIAVSYYRLAHARD